MKHIFILKMEEQVRIVIYANKYIFDDLIISAGYIKEHVKDQQARGLTRSMSTGNNPVFIPVKLCQKGLNSYLVSAYIYILKRSTYYRRSALRTLLNYCRVSTSGDGNYVILIKLRMIRHQYLDYKWNEIMTRMALERRELDHAMSWLSTLGGAFSALGDKYERCAEMAGKISLGQFRLAIRLGDPLLVARCKLYAALSLLQRGHLKIVKNMIKEIYQFAISEKDVRLQNMCKGVWAKFQYTYKQQRQLKKILRVKHQDGW